MGVHIGNAVDVAVLAADGIPDGLRVAGQNILSIDLQQIVQRLQGALGNQRTPLVDGGTDNVVIGTAGDVHQQLLVRVLSGEHIILSVITGGFFQNLRVDVGIGIKRNVVAQTLQGNVAGALQGGDIGLLGGASFCAGAVVFDGGLGIGCGGGLCAAGGKAQYHNQTEEQCEYLFHFAISFFRFFYLYCIVQQNTD